METKNLELHSKEKVIIQTEKGLKHFLSVNRKNIKNINGILFDEMYPIITVSNKHAMFYNVDTQEDEFLYPPFVVQCKIKKHKKYNAQYNVGRCKYLVNYHDGIKTHNDGSDFFDIKTFTNKKDFDSFVEKLKSKGYRIGN